MQRIKVFVGKENIHNFMTSLSKSFSLTEWPFSHELLPVADQYGYVLLALLIIGHLLLNNVRANYTTVCLSFLGFSKMYAYFVRVLCRNLKTPFLLD